MIMTATAAGAILGTAGYMSPEQAKGKKADARADIWAFGVVLYEMLTGKRAFEGETASEILAAVMMAEPDFDRLPSATPVSIRRLLRRCLNKDPRQRLQAIANRQEKIPAGTDRRRFFCQVCSHRATYRQRAHYLSADQLVVCRRVRSCSLAVDGLSIPGARGNFAPSGTNHWHLLRLRHACLYPCHHRRGVQIDTHVGGPKWRGEAAAGGPAGLRLSVDLAGRWECRGNDSATGSTDGKQYRGI
jgi:hypothetical protein